jgi:hypothetical protein
MCKIYKEQDPNRPTVEIYNEKCIGNFPKAEEDPGIYLYEGANTIIFGYNTKVTLYKDYKYLNIEIPNKKLACIVGENGKIVGLNNLSFSGKYELYQYMKQYEGLNVPYLERALTPEEHQAKKDSINRILERIRKDTKQNNEQKGKEEGRLNEPKAYANKV